jgi:Secretion system C-terminal sorting domain
MKQIYTKVPSLVLFFTLLIYLPGKLQAQCACGPSTTADSVVYRVSFTGLTGFYAFSMPQFNPALGTLTCMRMRDTVSSKMTFRLANRINDRFTYNINALQTTTISGPSAFTASSGTYSNTFGPYDLGTADISPLPNINPPEPDTAITVGPTNIFSNTGFTKLKTSGLASYLGIGTVPFTFDLSGPVWPAPSSGNFGLDVQSSSDVIVRLTYYYCAASILANSITGFSAVKSGNQVILKWTAQNEQNTDTYEIEYSKDGIHFSSAAKQPAYVDDAGAASKYEYQYNLAANAADRLYFRIKKTNAAGKSGYSAIRVINLGAGSSAISNFQLYPNPASKHLNVEWSSPVTGKVNVGIVNTTGQQVYTQAFELNGTSNIQLDMPASVKPGIYYLLVKDASTQTQQLTKLLIR